MENVKLINFKLHKVVEEYPDISHFATTEEEQIKEKDAPKYLAKKYAEWDRQFLDGLGETWNYIHIYVSAIIEVEVDGMIFNKELRSMGIGGLELGYGVVNGVYQDLGKSHINAYLDEEIFQVWQQLQELGIRVSLEDLNLDFESELEYE